ncbi:hypothetical protein ACFY89_29020 [Achromobacter spanius]|uniref:hypothetical protein n=1 Tax=Achromobacter spanius TaxID=217203 RepID=UPI0036E38621
MKEFGFEEWRLTVFWLFVAVAAGIVGFVFGWVWRDRWEALAGVRLLDVLTALGTLSAVFAAIWIANRQRQDSVTSNTRSGEVAYWIVRSEVLQLRDSHFPILESNLYIILHQPEGGLVPDANRIELTQVLARMSMEGTKAVIDKLPLIRSGAGTTVAEVYGRFERLKANLAVIAAHEGQIDKAFRLHVELNWDRILQLNASLKSSKIWD